MYGTSVVGESLFFAALHDWNETLNRFQTRAYNGNFRFQQVAPGDSFEFESTRITAMRASHMLDKPRLLIDSITTSRVGGRIVPPLLFAKFPMQFFVQFVFSTTIPII